MITESLNQLQKKLTRLNGTWHNQHNSELILSVDEQGVVSGTFSPGLSSNEKAREFPVVGRAENGVVGFVVVFHGFGSITSWTGQLTNISEDRFADTLHTSWHMAIDVGNSENQLWKAMITGADNFVRGPVSERRTNSQVATSHPLWLRADDLSSSY